MTLAIAAMSTKIKKKRKLHVFVCLGSVIIFVHHFIKTISERWLNLANHLPLRNTALNQTNWAIRLREMDIDIHDIKGSRRKCQSAVNFLKRVERPREGKEDKKGNVVKSITQKHLQHSGKNKDAARWKKEKWRGHWQGKEMIGETRSPRAGDAQRKTEGISRENGMRGRVGCEKETTLYHTASLLKQ